MITLLHISVSILVLCVCAVDRLWLDIAYCWHQVSKVWIYFQQVFCKALTGRT